MNIDRTKSRCLGIAKLVSDWPQSKWVMRDLLELLVDDHGGRITWDDQDPRKHGGIETKHCVLERIPLYPDYEGISLTD